MAFSNSDSTSLVATLCGLFGCCTLVFHSCNFSNAEPPHCFHSASFHHLCSPQGDYSFPISSHPTNASSPYFPFPQSPNLFPSKNTFPSTAANQFQFQIVPTRGGRSMGENSGCFVEREMTELGFEVEEEERVGWGSRWL